MILCVTPNVAIDRTLLVPGFQPGKVQRVETALAQAGGKGLNVARALRTLGGDPLAMGLLGGHHGHMAADLFAREGFHAVWTWFDGETRISTAIVPGDGEVTVLNENGRIAPGDWQHMVDDILANLEGVTVVCISGSLPIGAPDDAPADLVKAVQAAGVPVWIDTSGAPLRNAIASRPFGVKVNGLEIGGLLESAVNDPASAADAARSLRERGIETVVVTLGAQGAVYVDATSACYVPAPKIDAVSDVGSGDSFLAGLVFGLTHGESSADALRRAIAAGAANALIAGAGQFSRETFDALMADLQRQPVEIL